MFFNKLSLRIKVFSLIGIALALSVLSACGGKPLRPAPVEDRTTPAKHNQATESKEALPASKATQSHDASSSSGATNGPAAPTSADNAGKPGYYTVKQGDTLARIGLESGQNYRDIARWNNVENPNKIETGQVLRVIPPGSPEDGTVSRAVAASKIPASPLGAAADKPAPPASAAQATSQVPTSAPAVNAIVVEDAVGFVWPARGTIVAGFDESKNRKGLDISGAAGDPVLAAADGKVVYAGAGLRGYGNLIILKHSSTYLTAYAHNQALLVKEEQTVKQGQKIAEMGNTDADQVKLHFEVRKLGKPVDPVKYLPAR
jgi:lipoprotein NlpD